MSHLDEGIFHALLDDELDELGRAASERHLEGCGSCRERLAQERSLRREASSLVATLETPEVEAPSFAELRERAALRDAGASAHVAGVAQDVPAVSTRNPADPVGEPTQHQGHGRRASRGWIPALAWAATIAIAFGIGWFAAPGRIDVTTGTFEITDAVPAGPTEPARESATETRAYRETDSVDRANQPQKVASPAPEQEQEPAPEPAPEATPEPAPRPAPPATDMIAERKSTLTAAAPRTDADDESALADTLATLRQEGRIRVAEPQVAEEAREEELRDPEAPMAGLRDMAPPDAPLAFETTAPESAAERNDLVRDLPVDSEDWSKLLQRTPSPGDRWLAIDPHDAATWLGGPPKRVRGGEAVLAALLPGEDVPGGDPGRPAVMIVFLLDGGETVELIQQRVAAAGGDQPLAAAPGRFRRPASAARPAEAELGETLAQFSGSAEITWTTGDGYRIVLRGSLDVDRLRAISERVR